MRRPPYVFPLSRNSALIREIILGQTPQWSRGFMRAMFQLVNNALFTAMVMAVLIYSSPLAGLVVCAAAGLLSWAMFHLIRPSILANSDAKRIAISEAGIIGTQAVAGIKDVKMTGSEGFFETLFGAAVRR